MSSKDSHKNSKSIADQAAADWLPDSESKTTEISASIGSSTFIEDPFGLSTQEITDAQNSLEELDLDDLELEVDLSESEETLENLSRVMAHEQAEQIRQLEELTEDDAQDKAELLARQIAEDEELAKALHAQDLLSEEVDEVDPEIQAARPQSDSGILDAAEVESCIETMLFMSDKPVSQNKLSEYLGSAVPFAMIQEAITQLKDRYQKPHHGFELIEVSGGIQLRTKPIRAPLAKLLAKVQTQRLSGGAMETLAIIAFKQPALKEDIDQVRGVDSSHFIRGLLDKKLIQISGRSELPGRPMVYSTTNDFLELFGLKSLEDLPPLRELEQMVPGSQASGEDDPRVKQMRKLVAEMKENSASILDYDPKEDDRLLQEIRERVQGISITTATLEAQKQAAIDAAQARRAPELEASSAVSVSVQSES
jgi:segregation and condensation protein B